MVALLDVNVLVALAWPNHVHHSVARNWFAGQQPDGWATCSISEAGFVRVSSNRRVLPEAVTPSTAIDMLAAYRALPGHHFWPDDVSMCDLTVDPKSIRGYRQVTDAHLLSLAERNDGTVASFDSGLLDLGGQALVTHLQSD